jgi:hypothetical protein
MRALALIVVVLVASANVSRADQTVSNGQVIHTRLAPVVAHKVVPPFRGVHVYQGRASRR